MNKGKELIRFNCFNGKFCVNGESTPVDLNYLTKISIEPNVNTKPIYGDGFIQMQLVNDKGCSFILGMTNKCHNYEVAMKRVKEISGGVAQLKQTSLVEHALYFEFNVANKGEAQAIYKCWMFNCTTEGASEAFDQSTDDINESFVEHTGFLKGTALLKEGTSTEQAVDELGIPTYIAYMICRPTDPGYATFGDSIPVPRLAAII